ncbi:methyltransferase domain-containing protein [Leptospira weilii]|uniref:methyltransferase domain-containing protein n=1 Tax=Leptospira weilii TaxID=28184 RepID=UPI00077371C9|nr:methyltransferase domain-containing protein [Leptospira weilii]
MNTINNTLPIEISERYTRRVALRHEKLYGTGYQGPGSEDVFDALTARLNLKPGIRILDIGSGLGGDCFRLAQKHHVAVLGLDASPDMVEIARERIARENVTDVEFMIGNIRTIITEEIGLFDVLWTRDTGAFVPQNEKLTVWKKLHKILRPGGEVLITDYCLGSKPISQTFNNKMLAWGQHMITLPEYAKLIQEAGFEDIQVIDRTQDLLDSMLFGKEKLEEQKQNFLKELTLEEYEGLYNRWEQKIGFARNNELAWMVLIAKKATVIV